MQQRHQACKASSSTSTQWRTGTSVPLCKCTMQPILADKSRRRRHCVVQCFQFAIAQGFGDHGLQHRVGARRAAAQVGLGACRSQLKAQLGQIAFHHALEFLRVLQRAWRVVGHGLGLTCTRPCSLSASSGSKAGSNSLKSLVRALMRAAFSAYAGSWRSTWPQSLSMAPQPEALLTIASTSPACTAGTMHRYWRAFGPCRRRGR